MVPAGCCCAWLITQRTYLGSDVIAPVKPTNCWGTTCRYRWPRLQTSHIPPRTFSHSTTPQLDSALKGRCSSKATVPLRDCHWYGALYSLWRGLSKMERGIQQTIMLVTREHPQHPQWWSNRKTTTGFTETSMYEPSNVTLYDSYIHYDWSLSTTTDRQLHSLSAMND